ncbi:MAG: hypothetical protein AAF597_19455, partial [Bacteroidota bacterium]
FYAGVDGSATTEMTFTVFDSTGLFTATCSYFIEVTDDQSPQASCIAELEVFLDANGMATLDSLALDNGSTDNCGIDNFSLSQSAFNCEDVAEPVDVTQTVTDAEGLTGTCTVEVTVSDTIDPVLTCQNFTYPLDINGEFNLFLGSIEQDLILSNTDNCGVITGQAGIGFQPQQFLFTCADLGENPVTIISNDVNGNQSTCDIIITIEDTTAPLLSCDTTTALIFLDDLGVFSVDSAFVVDEIAFFYSDNCSPAPVTLTVDSEAFTCDDLGRNFTTVTVTDPAGLEATCNLNVAVRDTTPPAVTCLIDTVYLNEDGLGGYTELGLFEATDNCEVDFAPFDQAFPVDCSNIGTDISYTITVSDVNGNTAPSCDATIRVF